MMELKEHKSAWAALATLGVTAVAAGATAIVKIRKKQREQRQQQLEAAQDQRLSAEQMMVYNEAVAAFLALNDRIYELRRQRQKLQPLINWLATNGQKPEVDSNDKDLMQLAEGIERFLTTQMPFINACLRTTGEDDMTYVDYVRGAVGGTFDGKLDEEPTGSDIKDGTPINYVLKLGYYFPDSTIAPHPVKAIVL